MYCYKLKFKSPLHLGTDGGIGQEDLEERLHSDTLFSAIIYTWSLLFDDDINELCKSPKFKLSSVFPYINNIRFYPTPLGLFDEYMLNKEIEIKKWKKLDYIPENLLLIFLNSGKIKKGEIEKFNSEYLDKYYKKSKLYYAKVSERPRIAVDRLTSSVLEDSFFMSRDIEFNENSGLFFLVDFEDEKIKSKFDSSLNLLADNGIGADRAIGRGHFSFHSERIDLFRKPTDKEFAFLLSLYLPLKSEVEGGVLDSSWYTFKSRKGYVSHYRFRNIRRKSLNMIKEGSIISPLGRSTGDIVEVYSDGNTSIYRNGQGFFLAIKEFNYEDK